MAIVKEKEKTRNSPKESQETKRRILDDFFKERVGDIQAIFKENHGALDVSAASIHGAFKELKKVSKRHPGLVKNHLPRNLVAGVTYSVLRTFTGGEPGMKLPSQKVVARAFGASITGLQNAARDYETQLEKEEHQK
ncbi:MAG: hypothetical protein ACTSU5_12830 [Promethearchaeota archaeon]